MTYQDPVRQEPANWAPAQQRPRRSKLGRYGIVLIIFAFIAGCVGGLGVGFAAGSDSKTNDAGGTAPATSAAQPGAATTKAKPPAANTMDKQGILLVGTDIKPGTWRTTVPGDPDPNALPECYWARLKDLNGKLDSILDNNNQRPGDIVNVTIQPSDKAFETHGCGTWTKIA